MHPHVLQVLRVLREAGDAPVSGAELARRLGVSRTMVWKHVEALRSAGYAIASSPRLGHRLVGAPDAITPAELLDGLNTAVLGRPVEYRESVGSTNEVAKALARQGAPEGLLVVAEEQTVGKGRLGRPWLSPPGVGIWMSVILRPALPPFEAVRLTLCAAVAVAEAIRTVAGLPAGIKWPNDIVIADRKVCGILTEMEADWDRVSFAVVGCGINVNTPPEAFPAELRESATSLLAAGGLRVPRAPLARAVLQGLERAYGALAAGRFDQVLARWRSLSATLGRPVRVIPIARDQEEVRGVAQDVDQDGALVVRLPGGELHRVVAGEVSIRPEG